MSAPLPSRLSRRLNTLSNAVNRTLGISPELSVAKNRNSQIGVGKAMGTGNGAYQAEELETRRLFTTLVGGDVFEYNSQDPQNPTQFIRNRIVVRGNTVLELVGGALSNPTNANSPVIISDIPGRFFRSDIGRTGDYLGGVGGGGATSNVTPLIPGASPGTDPAAFTDVDIRAFAVAPDGSYWAFNVSRNGALGTAGETASVTLVRVNPNGTITAIADIDDAIGGVVGSQFANGNGIEEISAAAFDPISGRLYFVVRGNTSGSVLLPGGGGTVSPQAQQLFSIPVDMDSTEATVLSDVRAVPGTFGNTLNRPTKVTAIAFDQIGATSEMVAFVVGDLDRDGTVEGNLVNVLFRDTTTGTNALGNRVTVTGNGVLPTAVRGLGFVNENPAAADSTIYAIETASTTELVDTAAPTLLSDDIGAQVLTINRTTGLATGLGSIVTPGAAAGTPGSNMQSLAFDPFTINPFTGVRGTLLGIDNNDDGYLVTIDARNRLANASAFAIVITQSDATSEIIIGEVAEPAVDGSDFDSSLRPMLPFTGSAGTLRVQGATGQGVFNLGGPTGVGGVFLGLKSAGNQNADLNNIPVISGVLATSLGVVAPGTITAGIVSSPSLLKSLTNQGTLSQRLLGQNLTNIQGLAVRSTGEIIAVDTDGLDRSGNPVGGSTPGSDELYYIDRTTGQAVTRMGLAITRLASDGTRVGLIGNSGITTANIGLNGGEEILGVFMRQFSGSGSSTDGGAGVTLPGGFQIPGGTPVSMSVTSSGPNGYILVETPTQKLLYAFSRASSTADVVFTPLGEISDADGNTIGAAKALGYNSTTGALYTVGFSRGNPVPSQPTSTSTTDISGIDERNLTYANDGNIYILTFTGQGYNVQQLQRDLVTGQVTGLGAAQLINTGGSAIQGINDLTASPTSGNLLAVGSSSSSLLPTRNGGNLTDQLSASDFEYRGLARLEDGSVYAITSNGSTLNLRTVQSTGTSGAFQTVPGTFNVVPNSPRSTPNNIPGTDIRIDTSAGGTRGPTTAVLGITAVDSRPGDTNNIWGVGYSADTLLPTSNLLGDLGTFVVNQLSMSTFSPAYNAIDLTYTIPSNLGALGSLATIQYAFTSYGQATRDTATGGLQGVGTSSMSVQYVGFSPAQYTVAAVAGGGGTPVGEAQLSQTTGVANGIVDTHIIATDRLGSLADGYLTSGFNIDSPVPAAPIPGTLGNVFGVDPISGEANLRALAFASPTAPNTLEEAYALFFNGTGFDIYRMDRSATTGGITSFNKHSSGPFLLDPNNNAPIQFAYTLFRDPTIPDRFYTVGSSTPGSNPSMNLYSLTINANGVTVDAAIPITLGIFPLVGQTVKAGAVDSTGQLWIVVDGDGGPAGFNNNNSVNSQLYTLDPTTGGTTDYGAMGGVSGAGGTASPQGLNNSDIRAMQFHIDTDGREMLLALDAGGNTATSKLLEFDTFTVSKERVVNNVVVPFDTVAPALAGAPQVTIPTSPTAYTGAGAIGFPSSLAGTVNSAFTTFAIDQYGRGYSILPGSGATNTQDRIWVSPNELYYQDPAINGTSRDDNWGGENERVGWLLNEDGTAFMDSLTTATTDLSRNVLIAVVRNQLASSLRPSDPLFNQDRLYTLTIPGGAGNIANQTYITVSAVKRANSANDNGLVTVNSVNGAPGTTSNLIGLALDTDGSVIGLDQLTAVVANPDFDPLLPISPTNPVNITVQRNTRLVAIDIDVPPGGTGTIIGDPTFNTYTITDEVANPLTGQAHPLGSPDRGNGIRGFASDVFGRFYSADITGYLTRAVGSSTPTSPTGLAVSPNTVSLFSINRVTGVASAYATLADAAQFQQQPVLSRFGGFTFADASTIYLVQKDIRSTTLTVDVVTGVPVSIDRLVTLTLPGSAGSTVPFTRVNAATTAGAIQVGNTNTPPAGSNGTPTHLTDIEFLSNGQLIGLDNGPGGSNRLVKIDLSTTAAPTNAAFVSDPGTAGTLFGLASLNSQLSTIETGTSPDRILFSINDQALFSVNPATGTATSLGQVTVVGPNGATGVLTGDISVIALATAPGGAIYAILRGPDPANNNQIADILYTIDITSATATYVGAVRLQRDAAGNPLAGDYTRLLNIEFSGDRDPATGEYVLLGVNDPTGAANDRYLVRIDIDTPGQSAVVRGSTAGSISDSWIGFVSDVNDSDSTRLPAADRGRFFTLDAANQNGGILRTTPTQLYQFNAGLDANGFFSSARVGRVANLTTIQGGAVLDSIRDLDFSFTGQLFGVRTSANNTSSLVEFPAIPGIASGAVPTLQFAQDRAIQVTSATPLPGETTPTTAAPSVALVSDIFFIADGTAGGTLRAVDRSQGAGSRLIDIPTNNPSASVARTDPGLPSSTFVAFDEITFGGVSSVYAIDASTLTFQLVFDETGQGVLSTGLGGGGGGGSGALGSPVIGTLDVTNGNFTELNTGDPTQPGKLPDSITAVKALAFDNANTKKLYIVDQSNQLISFTITGTPGAYVLSGMTVIGVVRDAFTGAVINLGSMAFDGNGRLIGQDLDAGRAVDINLTTAGAGGVVASAAGSLPPTVGAIAYDPVANRFLAVDNATGNATIGGGQSTSQIKFFSTDATESGGDIGKILIGGTVTGKVNLAGSIGFFYAGWIATGSIGGLSLNEANPTPDNFYVGGDIGELLTTASLGTVTVGTATAAYRNGVDIHAHGRIGVVRSLGDVMANVRADNAQVATTLSGLAYEMGEVDDFNTNTDDPLVDRVGRSFENGVVAQGFDSGSFATATPLYAASNPDGSSSGVAQIEGRTANTAAPDYYLIPLLAGQTITYTLTTGEIVPSAYIGIFDPDGILVASQYVLGAATGVLAGQTFSFKADKPGSYRIAVGRAGDYNFNGTRQDTTEPLLTAGRIPYFLTVTGLGNLGISAVQAADQVFDVSPNTAVQAFDFSMIYAAQGDIGTVRGTRLASLYTNSSFDSLTGEVDSNTVRAQTGSIRAITAGEIGYFFTPQNAYGNGINFSAGGDVGLIQTTSAHMLLNEGIADLADPTLAVSSNPAAYRVGGDIQAISSAGHTILSLFANGGIGTIKAGDFAQVTENSSINVNADKTGNDGVIDLIDGGTQIGTLARGGIAINTNGGNVRYIRSSGPIFRDPGLGGGQINDVFATPGAGINFRDDSGATLNIDFDSTSLVQQLVLPQIGYSTYPIRGGGGVLTNVQVTGVGLISNMAFDQYGLVFTSSNGSVEISNLTVTGNGTPTTTSNVQTGVTVTDPITGQITTLPNNDNIVVIVDADGNTISQLSGKAPAGSSVTGVVFSEPVKDTLLARNDVLFTGSGRIDILSATFGDANRIVNETEGELLDLTATSVGTLSFRGDIGNPRDTVTGGLLQPNITAAALNTYPFRNDELVVSPGTVALISSGGSIGHINAVDIGEVRANTNGDTPSKFEGITGPIVATGTGGIDGTINAVRSGEGIASSGTGEVGGGGIYATGIIGEVTGTGDMRGTVTSQVGIGTVNFNGALINAGVYVSTGFTDDSAVTADFSFAAPINNSLTRRQQLANFDDLNSPGLSNSSYELQYLRGGAGIIGSDITAYDIKVIKAGGFGLFTTNIQSAGGGNYNTISVDGYGIRSSYIDAGARIGTIKLTGNGNQLSTNDVTSSVRQSEFSSFDQTGLPISQLTDIHAYLGTSAALPVINARTDTGVIESSIILGNQNLGSVNAYQIRGVIPGTPSNTLKGNTQISFGGNIGSLTTKSIINGLTLSAASITKFAPAGDVFNLDLSVSGAMKNFTINGNLAANSSVNAKSIGNFKVTGNFDGSLSADSVKAISVGGNLTNGTLDIEQSLGKLTVGGSISGQKMNITGNVGSIVVNGGFGTAGDTLNIGGNLKSLTVGKAKGSQGKVLATAITAQNIGKVSVNGRITGALTARGSISSIKVVSDGDGNRNLIDAAITSQGGDIGNLTVTGGGINANVSAFNNIKTVKVTGGSVTENASFSTTNGSINNVSVKGGNFLGDVSAANGGGSIGNLTVDGNLGDGVNPLTINAGAIKKLQVGGAIFSKATVNVTGTISQLIVGNGIQAGATIRADAIGSQKVNPPIDGDIILT